jgi:hypothetical protein
MAEATGTVTNFDGNTSSKKAVEIVGSFGPFCLVKYVPSSADDTAGTVDITFPSLDTIIGWIFTIDQNGANDANLDVAISSSGNVLTIADGAANYTLATTDQIFILVFGKARV